MSQTAGQGPGEATPVSTPPRLSWEGAGRCSGKLRVPRKARCCPWPVPPSTHSLLHGGQSQASREAPHRDLTAQGERPLGLDSGGGPPSRCGGRSGKSSHLAAPRSLVRPRAGVRQRPALLCQSGPADPQPWAAAPGGGSCSAEGGGWARMGPFPLVRPSLLPSLPSPCRGKKGKHK